MAIASFSLARRPSNKQTAPTRELEVEIGEIGAKGDGIARVSADEEIFVPYTAPRDVCRISAAGDRGAVVELISPSPFRATPPCGHFGRCGGCALQHLSPEFYLNWKRDLVATALRHAGLSDERVAAPIATPAASRRRAQFYASRRGEEFGFGFYERRSRRLVSISECHVLHPDISKRFAALKALARRAPLSWREFHLSVTACDNGLDLVLDHRTRLEEPDAACLAAMTSAMAAANAVRLTVQGAPLATFAAPLLRFDGLAMSPPPGGFLQASAAGETVLIEQVKAAVGGAKRVADLFCGSGTFALPLAKTSTATAVDSDPSAIAALTEARSIAQREGAKIRPMTIERRNLFERPMRAEELNGFGAIVLDPPRAGALAQAREIAASRAPLVVSVSCNPKTFARDAKALIEGGYMLEAATPVDQFVYSTHVEIVGVFRKKLTR